MEWLILAGGVLFVAYKFVFTDRSGKFKSDIPVDKTSVEYQKKRHKNIALLAICGLVVVGLVLVAIF